MPLDPDRGHIVISGGTGFIGGALVERLDELGSDVRVLTRQKDVDLRGSARPVRWDARSSGALRDVVENSQAVVHLAGEPIVDGRWNDARKRRIVESRVRTTALMADAIRRAESPPGIYLQASAVGYYGDRGDQYIEERARAGGDFLARLCMEWEDASRGLQERLRWMVMRVGVVLARHGGALPRMARPYYFFLGGPLGRGDQGVSWIHLEDLVQGMLYLLQNEHAQDVYNLTAPEPVSNRDFSRTLGRALRRPRAVRAPAWALRLRFGEMANALLTGQYVMPQRLLDQGFSFRYPTLESALKDLYR